MTAKRKLVLEHKQPWISGKRCPDNVRQGEIRNPKAEARKKAEIRRSKAEIVKKVKALKALKRKEWIFGFRVSDFFRPSDFGLIG
jgi:hypothetical protein